MHALVAAAIAAVLVVFSPGFSHLRTEARTPDGKAAGFQGLGSLFAGKFDTVKLVVVHGMGNHQTGFSDPLTEGIAGRLGLSAAGQPAPQSQELRAIGDGLTPPANFKFAQLRQRTFKGKGLTLEVFEVDWFPLADMVKQAFEKEDAKQDGERAWLNRDLKDNLVDDSLADPLLYLGASGPFIRNAVKQALCEVVHGTLHGKQSEETCTGAKLEDHAAVAFVTFSLGSRITFDSINELAAAEPGAPDAAAEAYAKPSNTYAGAGCARQLLGATARVYMLANQLPLLGLAGTTPLAAAAAPDTTGCPARRSLVVQRSSLTGFLEGYRASQRAQQRPRSLEVVTVSDPNDLLSYAIPPDFADAYDRTKCPAENDPQSVSITFVNVTTLIAQRFVLGTVANPVQAHTGHVSSKKVMKMLVDGRAAG